MENISELQIEYNEKMARLLHLAENILPEFKDSVHDIDILILKIFYIAKQCNNTDKLKMEAQLNSSKSFVNTWANILYNVRVAPRDWIRFYPISNSIEQNFESLSNEILLLEQERKNYAIKDISEL